ncbi:amidohydrolase family protein [Companilactobacillus huachuanensis]|uniref:Amidohydrolase family protein n=1 Tax=Companilactobacillus huachuanensis TaxID=2559914 RepID=A0ABW1RJ35_9LACO|nr:amidohydrolase family protein [Companilactobacillus huachuanensis]
MKIDVFAHVLPVGLLRAIQESVPNIIEQNAFLQIPALTDLKIRRENYPDGVKQIISNVNLNPEDYFSGAKSAELCSVGNEELLKLVQDNPDIFTAAVAMVPMNNLPKAVEIIEQQVTKNFIGIQLFTMALGKSIADKEFEPIFAEMSKSNLPIFLHPVFDERKPDNNITFSWEYELTQAMYQIVKAGYFEKYPNLKIIVHHAGAMIPFFAGRIKYTMTAQEFEDFKKFYVDTAILGNPKALESTVDFFGESHVVLGTDAPFAIMPSGATNEIIEAIEQMDISQAAKEAIYSKNILKMMR